MQFELTEVATCQAILPPMNGWLKVCMIDRKMGCFHLVPISCHSHDLRYIPDLPFSVLVPCKLKSEVAGIDAMARVLIKLSFVPGFT